ncbi:MAG: TFIIB-type zinc ribbon-containing protein [Clostridia bacterium]|nr:TFIIB-type zinc ribbon-containing protein [Clostridia bacterium]
METTVIYQCPNCGAGLEFDAKKQKFCCEFCLSEFTEDEAKAANPEEKLQKDAAANTEYNEHMQEFACPSCGAEVVSDDSTVAQFCAFCHNPVVLVGRLSGAMRPHRLIPFKYDKEQAKQKFLEFAKSHWFVPRAFFAKEQIEKISGIYYPFWVTDADTESNISASASRLRVWRLGNVEYTETSTFRIERTGNIHFEDITMSAFSKADKRMLEGVLPYPSEALEDFSMPYLSGFVAKKRDIERADLTGEVRSRMDRYSEQLLRNTVNGYNTVTVKDTGVRVKQSHWDYSLLPIWMLNYRDKKGRVYTYAMNGYTGKVYGELPISFAKLGLLLGAIALPLTGLLTWIGGMLF